MPKKPEQRGQITVSELPRQIARAVLVAPDTNPKTGQVYTQEVLYTLRPGWSQIEPYGTALPGGKIDPSAGDFADVLHTDELVDPQMVLRLDQVIRAGLRAAEREVWEELGIPLAVGLLHFSHVSTNQDGWTTYAYLGQLAEKPTVLVKPDSAGTRWLSTERILHGNPRLLRGHLGVTRKALKGLTGE